MAGPLQHIAMVAGGGSLPIEIADSVTARGGVIHVLMIDGEADAALTRFPHDVVHWSKLGRAVRAIRRAGVRDVIMVGRMTRPTLRNARPDLGFLMALPRIVRLLSAGGDDAVLRGVAGLFESQGLNVVSVADVAPELLIGDGALGRHAPASCDIDDMTTGFRLIAALGRYDIGQAAVVRNGVVEAIEGAEGTDRMMRRVAERRGTGNVASAAVPRGVLVKRAKPGQDLRLDLPAIGPDTIAAAAAAGLAGVAGMSGEVLTAERADLIAKADAAGLFIYGVPSRPSDAADVTTSVPSADGASAFTPLGRVAMPAASARDVLKATAILDALRPFATGTAVVINRRRVIAVGAGEAALDVAARAQPFCKRKRDAAVLVLAASEPATPALVEAVAASDIAGIALTATGPSTRGELSAVIAAADRAGLFLAAPVAARGGGQP
ncbi:MAG: LpxI family protein [Hyphomicrobium sp.]